MNKLSFLPRFAIPLTAAMLMPLAANAMPDPNPFQRSTPGLVAKSLMAKKLDPPKVDSTKFDLPPRNKPGFTREQLTKLGQQCASVFKSSRQSAKTAFNKLLTCGEKEGFDINPTNVDTTVPLFPKHLNKPVRAVIDAWKTEVTEH